MGAGTSSAPLVARTALFVAADCALRSWPPAGWATLHSWSAVLAAPVFDWRGSCFPCALSVPRTPVRFWPLSVVRPRSASAGALRPWPPAVLAVFCLGPCFPGALSLPPSPLRCVPRGCLRTLPRCFAPLLTAFPLAFSTHTPPTATLFCESRLPSYRTANGLLPPPAAPPTPLR